ncbi:MAG: hypothetical protein MK213_03200 [Planctomycetes bacterium]|nr:hypothetical protein [Planctomycetota bacterium]
MTHPLSFVALFALLAPPAFAQSDEVFMYGGTPGTSEWEVRRTLDLDGDGVFLSAGEAVQFAYDAATLVTYMDDIRFHNFAGTPAMFGAGGGDVILKMIDLDGDGVATGPGETVVFADTRAAHGVSNTSPDGVAFGPTGDMLFVTDDIWASGPTPGSGIATYVDIDGDGLALSAGEMTVLVDGAQSLSIAGTGGTSVAIDLGDFEAIMVDSNGVAIAFAQQDRMLYAFQDTNGDGDAMDAGEAWNFCNLIDDVPGLEVNADIAAGTLLPPRCASSSGTGWYGSLEALAVGRGIGTGGGDVYWMGSTVSSTSCNPGSGLIYRGEDLNNDGDLNDSGEVTLFLNGPLNNFMLYPLTGLADMDANGNGISLFNFNGPLGASWNQDSVYYLEDLNGDGDAMDTNETELSYFWAPDGCYSVALGTAPVGAFAAGPPQPYFETFGSSGTHSTGQQPSIGYVGTPGIGQQFDITLDNSLPNATNIMLVGWSNSQHGNFALPLDLGFYGMPSNNLYVSLDFQFPGSNLSTGQASRTFTVPSSSAYIGRDVYFQYYVSDPGLNPRGAITTDAVHGNIQ